MSAADIVKSLLPWIGTALGGPLGGVAANFVGEKLGLSDKTVSSVKAALSGMNAEELLKLKTAEFEFQIKMSEMGFDQIYRLEQLNINSATQNAADINKTMQAEASAEHWPTYSWRPAIGFAVAFNLVSSSFVVFIGYIFQPELVAQLPNLLTAQAGLNAVAMPILGIASWFRGKAQAEAAAPVLPTSIQTTTVSTKG